ncbi:MAG: DEAD/DEAH box helicase [Bacteroidaceae bacterium]
MKTFKDLGLSEEILKAIEEMGYENPMPVQEKVIPYLLGEGNDVVALAQTGTGKTAAFGLPTIQKTDIENRVPQTLILCPTRELCLQIAGDLSDYSKYVDRLKVLPVYGGSSIDSQIRSLKRGVHIVVATPGRLLDLMRRKTVQLGFVKNVIMDEADEMLNMGFTESINAILSEVPKDRNTLMFSATMSSDISRISKKYLNNAKEITIGTKNEGSKNVRHVAYTVHAKDKYMALKRIADSNPQIYGIVFCRTRKETQEIADKLIQDGYNADSLHGELSQAQRDTVMQKFRVKHLQILVATDVAARGLDVDDLTHVINYGLPDEVESYTHRSGRTGRAGKTGISIVIINLREKGKLRAIEHKIGKQFEAGVIPTGTEICEKQLIKVIDELEKVKVSEEDISAFLPEIYRKLEWLSKEDLIKRMVSIEFNRFLEYYRNADKLESPTDNGSDRRDRSDRPERKAEAGYVRLFINMGKMDGFYANQVIELINHNVRNKRVNIGRIDLMKNFSFFEVAEAQKDDVLEGLNNLDINGRRVSVEVAGAETSSPKRNSSRKSYGSSNRSSGGGGYRSKDKPSRSDRGYTSPRGAYKGKDRKRSDEGGSSSDRSSEGWARRKPNKR